MTTTEVARIAVTDISRRRLLAAGGLGMAVPVWLTACATAPLAPRAWPVAGPLRAEARDLALLNRVTWGIDSAALREFNRLGRRDWLDGQLHPRNGMALPDAVQAQIDAFGVPGTSMTAAVTEMEQRRREADSLKDDDAKKAAQQAYQQDLNKQARNAASQTLLRALYSKNQLQEQLTWFWFNHFNVHQYKSNLRTLVGNYEGVLRERALGRFGDLLIASATHPAMIRYLDNEQNAANRINENYAREVMELHTLGVDGGYSQKDVQELARVLTGLGTNFSDRTPTLKPAQQSLYVRRDATEFTPLRHDMGMKTVLGVTVQGRGWEEVIDQLMRLARHPSTARHVSRQLAVSFVSDQPPAALIDRMSSAYLASDGEIAVVMAAMFDAPEFTASLTHKFKDPVHYVVSAVRLAYDGRTIVNPAPMLGWVNRLGEGLYNRQTPDGYPLDAAAWSSSGQMGTRFEIARAVGSSSAGLFKTEGPTPVETPAFPQLSNALFHDALAVTVSPTTRAALDAATSPQEWNVLLLSSPEFMYR